MTTILHQPSIRFDRPVDRFAAEPAERRGLRRDQVRLLVAEAGTAEISHARFADLPQFLQPGDLVVINNSQTIAAELDLQSTEGRPLVLHVASRLTDGDWVIELRTAPDATSAVLDARPGDHFAVVPAMTHDRVSLPASTVWLREPYPADGRRSPTGSGTRLWRARIESSTPFERLLAEHGRPIGYGYLSRRWPLQDYQTVFGTRPGSAEMPSAGRPFSTELLTRLVADGVLVCPITLHTGVSSQEAGEGPQPEWFEVPASTARVVNDVRCAGGRVIAVGTTVTRALESAVDDSGTVIARRGWTEHVVGPDRPARVVSGLLTGWHDPNASHLLLVESVAGSALAQRAYDAAVAGGYLWHEFGDSCLLLP
ncbi:MAG TPA: S-adenosylmethionine:tRNA ribosyltransferase-isomerase [Jatrophihabitans sp.]|nr:S-adenosylmethionine:tRNA ribosyltransferase-isomerase [Jatrophihabitans sp.]